MCGGAARTSQCGDWALCCPWPIVLSVIASPRSFRGQRPGFLSVFTNPGQRHILEHGRGALNGRRGLQPGPSDREGEDTGTLPSLGTPGEPHSPSFPTPGLAWAMPAAARHDHAGPPQPGA